MILRLYASLMPVILGGVFNMIFVKLKTFSGLRIPLDGGKSLKDGRRIFGDSKTFLGFVGMISGTIIFSLIWGMFLKIGNLESFNLIYNYHSNTALFNIFTGGLLGFAYMLFELPNSFIKRRLDISAKNRGKFPFNIFVFCFDQIDSMLGVMLVTALLAGFSFGEYLFAIFIGGATHVLVNGLLILFKVRKYW